MSASALRKFPLGISDWNTIHQQNLFFVDKTDKLINLLTPPPSVYCTRAPYMGKTLLMSMIRELLTNGDQNFAYCTVACHS